MGVEGPTNDPVIVRERQKQVRNLLATLLLSQGVPMLSMGDEVGRTQKGNNNAYCQDNEISWTHWDIDESRQKLLDFTSKLIELRKSHPNFRRRSSTRIAPFANRWFEISPGTVPTDMR